MSGGVKGVGWKGGGWRGAGLSVVQEHKEHVLKLEASYSDCKRKV